MVYLVSKGEVLTGNSDKYREVRLSIMEQTPVVVEGCSNTVIITGGTKVITKEARLGKEVRLGDTGPTNPV